MNMYHGHAAWTSSMDMRHRYAARICRFTFKRHATRTCSKDIIDAAWICSIDTGMQYADSARKYTKDMLHKIQHN
jgi:hypothetical protein